MIGQWLKCPNCGEPCRVIVNDHYARCYEPGAIVDVYAKEKPNGPDTGTITLGTMPGEYEWRLFIR